MAVHRFDRIVSAGIAKQLWAALFDELLIGIERLVGDLWVLAIHVLYFTRCGKLYKPLMYVVK